MKMKMKRLFLLFLFYLKIELYLCNTCYITNKPPSFPKVGLRFCARVFPFETCCVPAFDEDISGYYTDLLGTSDLCAATSTRSTQALQYLFCFGCSDKQPKYLINEGIKTNGTTNYTLYSIVVCENLVKLLYPENFDDCGMVVPTERGSVCLGDGTVRPSDYWGSGEDGALNFLNDETGGKPPEFADSDTEKFQVIIDRSNGDSCYSISSGYQLSVFNSVLSYYLIIIGVTITFIL